MPSTGEMRHVTAAGVADLTGDAAIAGFAAASKSGAKPRPLQEVGEVEASIVACDRRRRGALTAIAIVADRRLSRPKGCYFEKKSGRSGPDGPHFVELGAYGLGWSHLTYMGGARNLA
jgi:hypothetical protein